jgi:hypothetical protein
MGVPTRRLGRSIGDLVRAVAQAAARQRRDGEDPGNSPINVVRAINVGRSGSTAVSSHQTVHRRRDGTTVVTRTTTESD